MAAVVGDMVVVAEHPVGEPVIAHELTDVLHDIQLCPLRRQWQQGDVVWHHEVAGEAPPGAARRAWRVCPCR